MILLITLEKNENGLLGFSRLHTWQPVLLPLHVLMHLNTVGAGLNCAVGSASHSDPGAASSNLARPHNFRGD